MFKIYLYNWAKNYNVTTGQYTLVKSETEVLSIPVDSPDKIWMVAPSVKLEVNKAESFDFTVMPGTEYYNAFIRLKTWIRVVYDKTTIFWGIVKTINNSGHLHKRTIHCEGVYSLLADSPVEGLEEDLQSKLTARTYLDFLIDSHNAFIEEKYKKFSPGKITVDLDPREKKRRPTSWTDTLSEIDGLIDEHGGYVRARYNDNWETNGKNRNFLDWVPYYFRDLGDGKRPAIKLAKNLIDISKSAASNSIFTRLIPVGHQSTTSTTSSSSSSKKKSSSSSSSSSTTTSFVYISGSKKYICMKDVPGMISSDVSKQKKALEADGFRKLSDFTNAEDNYGIIYKTESFSNASTSSDLKNYALEWIKHNYYGIIPNFSIKAIDMHMLGEKDPQILVGDVVDVVYPEYDNDGTEHLITRKLICKAIQYNLFNPESNTYTLGVPCDETDFEYGESSSSSSTTKSTATSTAASKKTTDDGGGGSSYNITWSMVYNWLKYYYYNCDDEHIVDWTETRWTTFNAKTSETEKTTKLLWIYDDDPYQTFGNNGEYVRTTQVEDGTDGDGNKIYKTNYTYTYAKFQRPDTDEVVRCRILGHYQIDSTKTKPAQVAKHRNDSKYVDSNGNLLSFGQPIDSTKTYGDIYHYGVCVSEDGHAYTFDWNLYARMGYMANYDEPSNDNENAHTQHFSTYFEIAKTNTNTGTVDTSQLIIGGTGDEADEQHGPVTYKNHNGMTTAEIAAEEGWSTFGYVTDDSGKVIPAVKLNDTVTYIDKDGIERTASGFITAQDLNLPEINSFTTKIAVIDNAILDRATVMELRAAIAILGGDSAYDESSYEHDSDGNVILDGNKWKLREGTKLVTNSKKVIAASGIYGVRTVTDPLTGRETEELYIQDGAGFSIEKGDPDNPGRKAYFGVWDKNNLTGGIIAKKINDETEAYILGDHINIGTKTTKRVLTEATDELAQVVGTYEWKYDSKGRKVGIKGITGAASYIWKDGAAYGIWDKGELNAGVMVTMINDETTTQIRGNKIKIGTKGTKSVSLTDAITINSEGYLTSNNSMWVQGDLSVTKTNGSGGTLRASNVTIGIGGALTFDGKGSADPSLSINKAKMKTLLDTTVSHVRITGPVNDKYTLWYLPAGSENKEENWKNCGNFNSATANAVVDWKSGGRTNSPAYLHVTTASGKKLYKAAFGGTVRGYEKYFTLVSDADEIPVIDSSNKRCMTATIHMKQGYYSDSIHYTTDFYKQNVYLNATPVWNAGDENGYDRASSKVKISYPKITEIKFEYPVSKTVGGTIVRASDSKTYILRNEKNHAYLSTQVSGSTDKWNNHLMLYHGQYDEGRMYEMSVMYTRFGKDSSGYYIEPYEDTQNVHDPRLSDGKFRYKFVTNTTSIGDDGRVYFYLGNIETNEIIPNTALCAYVVPMGLKYYTDSSSKVVLTIPNSGPAYKEIQVIPYANGYYDGGTYAMFNADSSRGVVEVGAYVFGTPCSGSGLPNKKTKLSITTDLYRRGYIAGYQEGHSGSSGQNYSHSATLIYKNEEDLGAGIKRYNYYSGTYISSGTTVHW